MPPNNAIRVQIKYGRTRSLRVDLGVSFLGELFTLSDPFQPISFLSVYFLLAAFFYLLAADAADDLDRL